jgi:hypothetical protein
VAHTVLENLQRYASDSACILPIFYTGKILLPGFSEGMGIIRNTRDEDF